MVETFVLFSNNFFLWAGNHWTEIFGVGTALLYIWLEIKQKSVMWVVGFISSFVFIFVYFQAKVYGSSALNIYYVAISIYGWYCWRFSRQSDSEVTGLPISRIRMSLALILTAIAIILFFAIGYVLEIYSDSSVPFYDALVTSLSIVATWMLARKILEHWLLWIFVNCISAALYFYLGLYPTTGLFIVYSVMSVVGWFKWRQSFNNQIQ